MKTSSQLQISFANAFADLYLDKENGEFALDFRRQEVTIYLTNTQYQALVLLVQQSLEDEQFVEYLNWQKDPLQCDENEIIEVCGPDHMVCMSCAFSWERVKLTFDIGMAIDLSFADFLGLASLIKEAQADLEWRRELLRLNANQESDGDGEGEADVDSDSDAGPEFPRGTKD